MHCELCGAQSGLKRKYLLGGQGVQAERCCREQQGNKPVFGGCAACRVWEAELDGRMCCIWRLICYEALMCTCDLVFRNPRAGARLVRWRGLD